MRRERLSFHTEKSRLGCTQAEWLRELALEVSGPALRAWEQDMWTRVLDSIRHEVTTSEMMGLLRKRSGCTSR